MLILALDQGTTNTKALLFDEAGQIVRRATASCTTKYPQSGWAEQSATEIWETTKRVIQEACAGLEGQIAGIGISNQRETLVIWDAETGEPVGPAPIWQCRRTAAACAELIEDGLSEEVTSLTGLGINPLFPASKLTWMIRNRPEAKALLDKGQLRAGTVDTWLLWNLTGGQSFATDHSNASRTLLFDTAVLEWSPRLAEIFGAPMECLPEAMASDARFGETAAGTTILPAGVPIHALMGDSHAALYGHGIRQPGLVKVTYGTGSSLMTVTDSRCVSLHGISGTIAWTAEGQTVYALEGNITVSAQAAAFMTEILGADGVGALSDLAETVEDSAGVTFVPALAGLGAPHWNDDARGLIAGLSHGTKPAHIARATFEAVVHQVGDVCDAMAKDLGHPLKGLLADGGGSSNAFLMQMQADVSGLNLTSQSFAELGAYGVASMVASGIGEAMPSLSSRGTTFSPTLLENDRRDLRSQWSAAVQRTM